MDDRRRVDVEGELGCRGAHQRDQPGVTEALSQRRPPPGHVAVEQATAEAERPARLGQRVLDREGHTRQRPVGDHVGILIGAADDRVQVRLHRLDRPQGRVPDLGGVELAAGDQPPQLGCVACGVVGEVHALRGGA